MSNWEADKKIWQGRADLCMLNKAARIEQHAS